MDGDHGNQQVEFKPDGFLGTKSLYHKERNVSTVRVTTERDGHNLHRADIHIHRHSLVERRRREKYRRSAILQVSGTTRTIDPGIADKIYGVFCRKPVEDQKIYWDAHRFVFQNNVSKG